MKYLVPLSGVVVAISMPVAAEETPLALKVAAAVEACATLSGPAGRDGGVLPIVLPLDASAAHDPTELDVLLACATSRRLQPVVLIEPPVDWQSAPNPYDALGGWLRDLERLMGPRHELLSVFQLGHRPELRFSPRSYAFLAEKVGTLLHSIDPEATLLLGSVGDGAGAWLDEVDLRSLAPYVGGIALADPVDLDPWVTRMARDFPALRLWLYTDPACADPDAFLSRFHRARAAGIQTVVAPFMGGSAGSSLPSVLLNLALRLPPRFIVDMDFPAGGLPEGGISRPGELLAFEDPLGPEKALIVREPGLTAVEVGPSAIAHVRAFDLVTGAELTVRARDPGPPSGPAVIELPLRTGPALIVFIERKDPRAAPETIAVTEERELTVEEIIAGERAFQAAQARALDHYQAKAIISYHYRAETLGQTIDVTSVNRFYWKAGTGEYEETELLVNGARWRGAPPALPFIQAEKVKEVPLEIRLDQSYDYRLKGRDTLRGRRAYVVEFEPVAAAGPLYSGEVWVDERTFAPLRIRLVQHGLKPPITSNTDVIDYGPVDGASASNPEGSYWLPVQGYRQMVFTAVGRTVVAERLVTYEGFSINSDQFDLGRQQAYASGHPVLRESESGYSYLVKEGDGIRLLKPDSLVNVAFFGGLGVNADATLGTAFAGLNYFNFNWRNTGTQMDIAFAGLLADIAWTDPSLGGSRWELTLDGRFVAIEESFHRTTDSGRVEGQDVETLQEQALVTFSRPITSFQKAVFQLELDYDDFGPESDTDPNFLVPESGFTGIGTARWNYHRRGYQIDLWFSAGHRFSWADWGLMDPNGPAGSTTRIGGSAGDTDYRRGGLSAFKSFYPGKSQSLSMGLSLFDGVDMDRFSRFRIGDFRNARVRGFSSDDLTFDRGITAQIAYNFALPRVGAGVELGLDAAAIENQEDFDGREYVAGAGAALSFNGPWGTLMTLRTHMGLGSSLEIDSSGASLRIVMIKTLDHWPRRRSRSE